MSNQRKEIKSKMVKIQVPLREDLRLRAEEKAYEMGFGSVQEVLRLFLAGFVRDEYSIGFNPSNKTLEQKKSEVLA